MDCGDCVFNIMNDGPPMSGGPLGGRQIGCRAGRIEKLIDKGKATMPLPETSYELTQFCNMYRDTDVDLETAREQVMPLFGIVINHGLGRTVDDLNKTVDSLIALDYPEKKIKIVISTLETDNPTDLVDVVNRLKEKFPLAECVFHLHNITKLRDTECFRKLTEASYFVKMTSGDQIPVSTFKQVDEEINERLNMTCLFDAGRTTSIVFKKVMRDLYLEYNDYDASIENIRQMCLEKGSYKKIL